ncbi:MAG TPA: DUF1080 domain-containing protein [Bacteroidales bacterium]|nr:DUF1080 domain-containing protein [Bacteroidales bacterium]
MKKQLTIVTVIVLIMASSLYLEGCRGKKAEEITASEAEVHDSTYIFNGKDLSGWEITNFGPQGPVMVSKGEIILGMGDGCTGITYKKPFPLLDYVVCLEAKKVAGNDFFCGMTFPVDKEPCTLIVGGWAGTTVGLSSINGNDASENRTTTLMKFEKDRWYEICLSVRKNEIKAWIDDSLVVDFKRKDERLSIRPEVFLSQPFGIASWNTTAALRNIRVTRLE